MAHLSAPAQPLLPALARLLGESERTVRLIVPVCCLLAALATAAWVGSWIDSGWLPNTNEGSARVLRGFIGLSALLWVSVSAGLLTAGRWAAPLRAAAGNAAGLLR